MPMVEHTLAVAGKARTAGCSRSPLPSSPSPSLLSGSLHHGPMTRRLAYPLSIVAATVLASATALRAQNFDTVQVKVSRVAGPVYLLEGAGGNIGLVVGDDAVFVVDGQFAPLTPKILAAIKSVTPQPVRFVVNTHWHSDHTGGNENIANAGALIFAHENVRRRMSTGQFIEALNRTEPAAAHGALPVVTFTD